MLRQPNTFCFCPNIIWHLTWPLTPLWYVKQQGHCGHFWLYVYAQQVFVTFVISNSFKILTFVPSMVGWTMRSMWTLLHACLCPTGWFFCYFCQLKYFQILTFFDLWFLNGRLDNEVTMDTFACLSVPNRLTLLFLAFKIVTKFTVRSQVVCNLKV